MYGRSRKDLPLGVSSVYDTSLPYNNDRLDDAVSEDYSRAVSGVNRQNISSGAYASQILRTSVKRQNEDTNQSSGIYSSRIGNSERQNTSTPELPLRNGMFVGSGNYATKIGNQSKQSDSNRRQANLNNDNLPYPPGMDRMGRTMHERIYENRGFQDNRNNYHPPPILENDTGIQGLESPRSTQWPETARSYPPGFEASHLNGSSTFIPPIGESTDGPPMDRRKQSGSPIRQSSRTRDDYSNTKHDEANRRSTSETPAWATRLLTSSLIGKFRNMRAAIDKWTLRRRVSSQHSQLPLIRNEGPTAFDMFGNPVNFTSNRNADGTANLLSEDKSEQKAINLAVFLFGLILMFVLVFPVIVVIAIFTDQPDYVQANMTMTFNGSITALNISETEKIKTSLCKRADLAFSNITAFKGCNITEFRNGPNNIIADIAVLFKTQNFPSIQTIKEKMENEFSRSPLLYIYFYVPSSIILDVDYSFLIEEVVNNYLYKRST